MKKKLKLIIEEGWLKEVNSSEMKLHFEVPHGKYYEFILKEFEFVEANRGVFEYNTSYPGHSYFAPSAFISVSVKATAAQILEVVMPYVNAGSFGVIYKL